MTTMSDVKAGFYDAQRQAANAFEIMFSEASEAKAKLDAAEKAKLDAAEKPTEPNT